MFPGSFSRCTSSTDFRWALHNFKSIRKVSFFYVEIYIQGTWVAISFSLEYSSRRLFPMVAGWSSIRTEYTSERNEGPSGFLFFKLKCHLKKNITVENIFAITSSLIWKRGELYESKIKLNYIQQFEIQTVLKLLFQRSNWVIRSASISG